MLDFKEIGRKKYENTLSVGAQLKPERKEFRLWTHIGYRECWKVTPYDYEDNNISTIVESIRYFISIGTHIDIKEVRLYEKSFRDIEGVDWSELRNKIEKKLREMGISITYTQEYFSGEDLEILNIYARYREDLGRYALETGQLAGDDGDIHFAGYEFVDISNECLLDDFYSIREYLMNYPYYVCMLKELHIYEDSFIGKEGVDWETLKPRVIALFEGENIPIKFM